MDDLTIKRTEIIDGCSYIFRSPFLGQSVVTSSILVAFHKYFRGKNLHVFSATSRIRLSENNVVRPDISIFRDLVDEDEDDDGSEDEFGRICRVPELIVEVLSHETAFRDKVVKRRLYERHGVKEYWIVSTFDRSIDVFVLNEKGRLELYAVYCEYHENELKRLSEEERAAVPSTFSPYIFPDMEINIQEVFQRLNTH